MIIGICDACGNERKIINVGMYEYKGKMYYIRLCQWCRAAATRRKRAMLPEPFLNRKGDK